MSKLVPEEAASWRVYRIVGLALIYFLPMLGYYAVQLLDGASIDVSVLDFVYPSPRRFILVCALGWQIYQLRKPTHERPKTMVLYEDANSARELFYIGLALFLAVLDGMGDGFYVPVLSNVIGDPVQLVALLMIFAFRTSTTIDGEAQRIVHFGWVPRVIPFSEVAGLGTIEVRVMRAGTQVGAYHQAGLFLKGGGAPIRLCGLPGGAAASPMLHRIAAETGLPMAPAA